MENKKELENVKLASKALQLALGIYNIYNIGWEKAQKMALDIVQNKSSDADAFMMRLNFIKENRGY